VSSFDLLVPYTPFIILECREQEAASLKKKKALNATQIFLFQVHISGRSWETFKEGGGVDGPFKNDPSTQASLADTALSVCFDGCFKYRLCRSSKASLQLDYELGTTIFSPYPLPPIPYPRVFFQLT